MVPGGITQEVDDSHVNWYYADIARQFDTLGLHHDLDGLDFENEPYTDQAEVAAAEASGNVAMLDLVQLERPRLWSHMFESNDVLPFVPV